MQKVRILLRVSSNQQLEKDGDLSVQRELILLYIKDKPDWYLDEKEYFEGSNSGFKNSVQERDVLQEALDDAKKGEYDILVVYKDDRIGRRMWEIGAYINELKKYNVDVYTTVDGCISPEADDMMGQMMLALRYNAAEKSSRDTGVRVRDSAVQLVKQGKFMGGTSPYGYELVYSGELSKHGRALKKLVIVPEKSEVVKYIYNLYLYKGYGAYKIAKILNADHKYKDMPPNQDGHWKAGTINSILSNPIYVGLVTYKRRERKNGMYHRMDQKDWITAKESNQELVIIDADLWNKAQDERERRRQYYSKKSYNRDATMVKTSHTNLILLDVIYCASCGSKLTNATKYNYWTIKATGERRTSKIPAYKCMKAGRGEPHDKNSIFRADEIEKVVLNAISNYILQIQSQQNAYQIVLDNQMEEKKKLEMKCNKIQAEQKKSQEALNLMLDKVPDAIQGMYTLSIEDLNDALSRLREKIYSKKELLENTEALLKQTCSSLEEWDDMKKQLPSWIEVLNNSDCNAKRMLINQLIERVEVSKEKIVIRFRITLDEFKS